MRTDGERVKAWRTRHQLTQRQGALLAGVDPNTWARWERNERETPAPVLRLLIVLDELWAYQPAFWRPWWQPPDTPPQSASDGADTSIESGAREWA